MKLLPLLILPIGLLLPACSSTPDLCERACTAWTTCVQVAGNTVNYPYETCYDECIEEGDWDLEYVLCTESYRTCPEIGNNCG